MMKNLSEILRNLTLVGQLGLSLAVPILLCLAGCYLLTTRAGVGTWIYIPGFILGLGSSFATAWKFYQSVMAKEKKGKSSKKSSVSYNDHR